MPSVEFSRPESRRGQPFSSPGDLPNPGIEPRSPTVQVDSLPAELQGKPKNTGMGSLSSSPVNLPHPGIEPESPALQADSLSAELPGKLLLLLLLLLLLSHFSCVRLCATPWAAAYQASPSMGFSRQEHWSGLPFPSPMHESGK